MKSQKNTKPAVRATASNPPKVTVRPADVRQPVAAEVSPARPQPGASKRSWLLVCAAGTVVFGVAAYLAHKRTFGGWELHVFRSINDWPNSLHVLFRMLTIFPDSLWIAVAVIAIVFFLKLYRLTWQLAAATLGGFAAAEVMKKVIDRPRPADLISNVHVRIHETGNGFPSGHTMLITVLLLVLWPWLPKGWRWLTLLLIPAMAVSRVYLGVHEPLDVVGGAALGMMVVGAMNLLPRRLRQLLRLA